MQRFGQFLPQAQRIRLGWPRKQGTEFRKAPSYTALYNLLTQLDPHAFAQALNQWLQTHHGTLRRALAVDGKYGCERVLTPLP